ncbi:MAG TPA: hypothetical protein DIS73_07100, partial [Planctomycetia bacterium]|nr:hypothetical protein [Planctomycetia bacterium]
MAQHGIVIRGAREHNLKNIDVVIPRDKLVVITGLSGSGKSSLAFDTIYAEGQRRYVESLSAYARQFLEQMSKPDVDSIEGLSPAISIEQKTTSRNPRSTVGTITEIYDYLRLLFARIGHPYCYQCGKEITAQTVQQMVDRVLELPADTRLQILAPIVRGRKGEYRKELSDMKGKGFVRARIDGEIRELEGEIALDKNKKHTIEIVIDRIILKKPDCHPEFISGSQTMHGQEIPKQVRDDRTQVRDDRDEKLRRRLADSIEIALRISDGIVVINQIGGEDILFSERLACIDCGISYPEVTPRVFSFNSPHGACPDCDGLGIKIMHEDEEGEVCPSCRGNRLKKEALSVKIHGNSIVDVTKLSIKSAVHFFKTLRLSKREGFIGERILKEIRERLQFLSNVGLDYLTLDREASTLSGGEGQRIRLATQIGSSLVGVLYVLDEPSIGLHQRDNLKLINTLRDLVALGNTLVVVEHDRQTIESADHLVEFGPKAGDHGGEITFTGTIEEMKKSNCLTGQYLSGEKDITSTKQKQTHDNQGKIRLTGCTHHNLKNIDVDIPRNKLVVITGLSGSGKSSLAFDTIFAEGQRRYIESLSAYARQFLGAMHKPDVDEIEGLSPAISIDQKSRSNNPRSTVATITEIYDYLRVLYARVGKPHCLVCGREVRKHSNEEILGSVLTLVEAARKHQGPALKNPKGRAL